MITGAALLLLIWPGASRAQNQVELTIDQTFIVNNSNKYCYYDGVSRHFYCLNGLAFCLGSLGSLCPDINALNASGLQPDNGNISNDPQIQFDQPSYMGGWASGANACPTSNPPVSDLANNICNSELFLCAGIGYNNSSSSDISLDMVEFEIVQYKDGTNPLDPSSTPPLRTFFIDQPGILPNMSNSVPPAGKDRGPYCVLWDGAINVQGGMGKINGQYGFRVTAQTNQTGASGNITITAVRAYPAGTTLDATHAFTLQKPITVDVADVHVVRSSPSIVGSVTGVYAEPYNLLYRLSKDATMYITITDPNNGNVLRQLIPGLPRAGEGQGTNPAVNGDSWNGRADNGALMPSGVYLATLQAHVHDQYGDDLSYPTTVQIGLDPLQITDLRVQPLAGGATSLATLSYMLTEPATVYIDIYPPNTQFCGNLNQVTANLDQAAPTPKNFLPAIGGCPVGVNGTAAPLVRHIEEVKTGRSPVLNFWDGRDSNGNAVCMDGNYVFVIYAALPSANGNSFQGNTSDRRIWTSKAQTGLLPVIRGNVGLSQVAASPTVVGSSPSVSGLNPFAFRYSLGRDAITSMSIYDNTGTNLVKTLVNNVVRPGMFPNQEIWNDATDDNGRWVSSGTYLVQLTAADPLCPAHISTVSASFSVDPFRITDVLTAPLLPGASNSLTLSYQLSQPMNVVWNLYAPGTVIRNTATTWPPCGMNTSACANVVGASGQPAVPVFSIQGTRPGRLRITEFWDGRDSNGLLVPDGSYVFTLVAQSTTTPQYYADDKIFGSVTVGRGSIIFTSFNVQPFVPPLFNSSATITLDPFTVSYALTRQSSVTIQVLNSSLPNSVVRTLFAGSVRDGSILLQDLWDGRDDHNNIPPAGAYLVRAVAQDVASQLSQPSTVQMTISYNPLRVYDVAIAPLINGTNGARILYQVSEPMKVAVKIYQPGTVFDSFGNPSPPESVSLVKRIVGVRPARTAITETWDGTDLRRAGAPDGTYKFSIVASTDMNAIDNMTGDVLNASALATDHPVDDVSVVRNESIDPKADFENNTYVYPNPVDGDSAHFVIYTPFQADAKLKIYTMNGDLVLDRDLGTWPAGCYVQDPGCTPNPTGFVWNRANAAGRRVARGVYFAVIRIEDTLGGRNVLQTVRKLLVR